MLGRLWPRFVLEACFLIAVAVIAGLLRLSTPAIVAVMLISYLATVAVEWTASRGRDGGHRRPAPARAASVSAPEPAGGIVTVRPAPPLPEEFADEAWLDALPDRPEPEPEPDRESEPEPARPSEPQTDPLPTAEPQPAEPQPVATVPDPGPDPAPAPQPIVAAEPEPEPVVAATPEPEPEPEPLPQTPAAPPVARLQLPSREREWSLWEIERLARERAGDDPVRDEEWGYLLVYLREFASSEGLLPTDFDALVRESFGDLIADRAR